MCASRYLCKYVLDGTRPPMAAMAQESEGRRVMKIPTAAAVEVAVVAG